MVFYVVDNSQEVFYEAKIFYRAFFGKRDLKFLISIKSCLR